MNLTYKDINMNMLEMWKQRYAMPAGRPSKQYPNTTTVRANGEYVPITDEGPQVCDRPSVGEANKHRARGEQPCEGCLEASREYMRTHNEKKKREQISQGVPLRGRGRPRKEVDPDAPVDVSDVYPGGGSSSSSGGGKWEEESGPRVVRPTQKPPAQKEHLLNLEDIAKHLAGCPDCMETLMGHLDTYMPDEES